MDGVEFQRVCDAAFRFLADEYQYRSQGLQQEPWLWSLIYFGPHAAVGIIFEHRDHYLSVELHPLIRGELIQPYFERRRNSVDVQILLDVLSTGLHPFPPGLTGRRRSDAEIKQIISGYASAVQIYATDLLRGDFSILPTIQDYIAARA